MKKKLIFLGLLFTIIQFARAERQDSVGITKINGILHLRYMVSPGETIYRISTTYKVSVSDLMDINPELENGLKTGQILSIPYNLDVQNSNLHNPKTNTPKVATQKNNITEDTLTENGVIHTIQPGETYTSIAKKYQISIDELLKVNKIALKIGQKIVINDKLKANVLQKSEDKSNNNQQAPQKVVTSTPILQPIVANNTKQQLSEDASIVPLIPIEYSNIKSNLLVIPFDPYLYFSDADDEIASVSKMPRTKIRQAFRRRLSALIEPKGYEITNLLGGKAKDSITDLNKIYSSVNYSYQDILYNSATRMEDKPQKGLGKDKNASQIMNVGDGSRAALAKDTKKYFGVRIANPDFFTYFNNKYKIDYYLFINQFEVKTNYENCLDRATLNYERGFTIHYSIFDKMGKQIAGNRIYIDYNSNTNNISKILADNMQRVADKIMADLPAAK